MEDGPGRPSTIVILTTKVKRGRNFDGYVQVLFLTCLRWYEPLVFPEMILGSFCPFIASLSQSTQWRYFSIKQDE